MVQPAWPFWPDLRVPEPYGAEAYRDYEVSQPYGVEPYREYDVLRPEVPADPPASPPPRAAARVDLNAWRGADRSQPVIERVLQGRVVTVLERAIPSRDPFVGEWWRVITPTGLEAYLAGTGPRGEPYLDILFGELPGFARTLSTLTVPREPVPGDPCLTGDGCLVHPPHVIDPNARTSIRRESLRASTARIPKGSFVDVLSPQVNVTVTEAPNEDGEVFAYFTPDILGSHTFYKIRYCYPGTNPLQCVEGWTERYNLVPGALPGRHIPADEATFWEDVGDFITDPDTWAVIGTIATVGNYGWVAGILGSAQSIAMQEAMKGLAGMFLDAGVCVAAGHPVSECTIGQRSPNFVNGWKAQVAIRARLAAIALAGPAATTAKAALATKIPVDLVNAVTAIGQATSAGSQWRDLEQRWTQQKRSDEQIRRDFLDETQRQFANDPDPMKRREDVQAIGVNYHLRRNLFDDVMHWDPATGRRGRRLISLDPNRPRPNSTSKNYTVDQLEALWRKAEQRRLPQAVVNAFRARYERAKHLRDNLGITLVGPSDIIALSVSPTGEVIEGASPGVPADRPSRLRSFFKDAFLASALTSPAWITLLLLPWLRKRRSSRSRSRSRDR